MFRLILFCLLLLLLTACQSAVVSIGAIAIPAPVLVGPVLTLGGRPAPPPDALATFAAGAVAVLVDPVRTSSREKVDRSFTDYLGSQDSLPQALQSSLDGRSGRALYVERIRVVDAVHWTLLFWIDKQVLAQGYVFDPAPVGRRGENP